MWPDDANERLAAYWLSPRGYGPEEPNQVEAATRHAEKAVAFADRRHQQQGREREGNAPLEFADPDGAVFSVSRVVPE